MVDSGTKYLTNIFHAQISNDRCTGLTPPQRLARRQSASLWTYGMKTTWCIQNPLREFWEILRWRWRQQNLGPNPKKKEDTASLFPTIFQWPKGPSKAPPVEDRSGIQSDWGIEHILHNNLLAIHDTWQELVTCVKYNSQIASFRKWFCFRNLTKSHEPSDLNS